MQIIAPDIGIRNRPETKLLIHPTGADGSTAFTDAARGGGRAITPVGNACVKTLDMRHPYATRAIYMGASAYLSAAHSAAQEPCSGNFAFETWIYCTTFSTNHDIINTWTSYGWRLIVNTAGKLEFMNNNGSAWTIDLSFGNVALTLYTWAYVALARSGNIFRAYVNTALAGTGTSNAALTSSGSGLKLGANIAQFNGYIRDLRFRVGTDGGWTGPTIAVPTAPVEADQYTQLLIRGDNVTQPTTFKDLSPTPKTITAAGGAVTVPLPPGSSSIYLDGSGDYLKTPSSADFDFGNGDFTIHFWANFSSLPADAYIFDRFYSGNSSRCYMEIKGTTGLVFYAEGSGGTTSATWATALGTGVANHIALQRASGVLSLYVNGIKQSLSSGSLNSPTSIVIPNELVVAASQGYAYPITGYVRGFTVARRAIWNRNFTIPNRLA